MNSGGFQRMKLDECAKKQKFVHNDINVRKFLSRKVAILISIHTHTYTHKHTNTERMKLVLKMKHL